MVQPPKSLRAVWKLVRRVGIAVVGSVVLLAGVAMLVLPGPGLIVIPIGLGILSLEFSWAARWRHTFRVRAERIYQSLKERIRKRRA